VLSAFSPERRELSLRDIAETTNVSQPSALKIGYTLVQSGYLVRNPVTKGYRLGPEIVSVGMATLNALTLPELAEPYLIDLRDRTQETVKLAIHAGPAIVFVARIPSLTHAIVGNTYVGTSLPIHASSVGRAILAWLPEETAERLLSGSSDARLTKKTLTKDQARRRLAAIRKRGYDTDDQGVMLENRAIAAPVFDAAGVAVGAINITASAHRVTMTEIEEELGPLVVECAQVVSSILPPSVRGAGWTGF
jgi:IclR family transcriptional regulator, pca regulon regulatory protein